MMMLVRRSVALLLTVSLLLLSAGATAGPPGARKPGTQAQYTPPAADLVGPPVLFNTIITQGFDTVTGTPPCVSGWSCQNLSDDTGAVHTDWFQGNPATFPAQAGVNADSYIAANFENTAVAGVISNWLITPQVNFNPGAVLSFYTRTVDIPEFADRLEVRISTNGGSLNVGATSASVGDFTTLIATVNPSLLTAVGTCPNASDGYPNAWCQITLTSAQGIPTSGNGRIAFRYFVNGGGPGGTASDYIGIDSFVFDEGIPIAPPVLAYSPPATWTVPFTGGTIVGSTGTATIAVSIGTAGAGVGAPATTTTTCTAPTAPFSGFAETVTAVGAGAPSGGPLTGACILGATSVTQTLTCSEVRAGVPTPVKFTLYCPAAGEPVFLGAASRRVHGAAGTFDLPLSPVFTNPTIEPRQGPLQSVVFTFDHVITGATSGIGEGSANALAATLNGNEVTVGLTGVTDRQYVTVVLTNVSDATGNTGGSASVRIGFLLGDVNGSRVVTLADLGQVNAQLAQLVSSTNFTKDVNASGTLTLTDKALTNGNLTQSLPPP